jgi:UrcA family protein
MDKWWLVAFVLGGIVLTKTHATAAAMDRSEIRVRYDRRELASPAGAHRLLGRIGDAALESCGASMFSLVEFKAAIMASRCWRDAVDDAVRHVDDPLLTAAAREGHRPESH